MHEPVETNNLHLLLRSLTQFAQQQATQGHRGWVILQGDLNWQTTLWRHWVTQHPHDSCLQLNNTTSFLPNLTSLTAKQCRQLLGQNYQHAFFSWQSEEGLDLNALGIITGTLTAGGLCFIGLPSQTDFLKTPNPATQKLFSFPFTPEAAHHGFHQHFLNCFSPHADGTLWLKQNTPPPPFKTVPNLPLSSASLNDNPNNDFNGKPTADQQKIINAIHSVAFGHRHRPLVLTADRGRGKSAALGIAAAHCLLQGKTHIALTASHASQIQTLLQFCQTTLKNQQKMAENSKKIPKSPVLHAISATKTQVSVTFNNRHTAQLQFYAPDTLLEADFTPDLLLVDEAASLPLPILEKLLHRFARTVFATTLHGYEGSGRGFGIKFKQALAPYQWKHLSLHTPIRWSANDPVEQGLQKLLCLDTHAPNPFEATEATTTVPSTLTYQKQSISTLTPQQLQQVMQLLTHAHYQTQPNDLLQLLTAPNLHLFIAQANNQILGVLLAIEEGNLPLPKPKQRFRGHLVPQQLYQHTQHPDWLTLKTWRILRVAVDPCYQGQNIGSQLVQTCLTSAHSAQLDAVTTSFGATSDLTQFWQRQDFAALLLGLKKDAASASHALTLIHPLSDTAQQLTQQQQQHYRPQFAHLLNREFSHLPAALVWQIATMLHYPPSPFPQGYLNGQPFEALSYDLKQWALSHPKVAQQLPKAFCQIVCQSHPWQVDPTQTRKQIEQQWKNRLAQLVL